jgi:hypothetical protein
MRSVRYLGKWLGSGDPNDTGTDSPGVPVSDRYVRRCAQSRRKIQSIQNSVFLHGIGPDM